MNYRVFRGRAVFLAGALAVVVALSCGPAPMSSQTRSDQPRTMSQPLSAIDPAKSLLIRDLSVVNASWYTDWFALDIAGRGAWSFGRLMDRMRGTHSLSEFVLSWLSLWETDQAVNQFTAAARPGIRQLVIDPWRVASHCAPGNGPCNLNFSLAPFRLLAIVYRPDLRQSGVSGVTQAGEGRFVFGLLDPNGNPLLFTVIFEYELVADTPEDVRDWARTWAVLSDLPFGTAYDTVLYLITNRFSARNGDRRRPNGSALNQLRTNEVALSIFDGDDPTLWELREFTISPSTGLLAEATVKQTPDLGFNNSQALADELNSNAAAILAGTYRLPDTFAGASAANTGVFDPVSGTVLNPLVWNAPGVGDDVRQAFAANTCSGCHLSETNTIFLHVVPRIPGTPAPLSSFLVNQALPQRLAEMNQIISGSGPDAELFSPRQSQPAD